MGMGSWVHWLIVALVILVLFGRGRISEMMGDLGKGVKSFRHGMNEEPETPIATPPRLEQQPPGASSMTQQGQAQAQRMSYDPVTAPPTTDPNPPHVEAASQPVAKPKEQMPYDPVTAPPSAGNGGGRSG